MTDMMMRMSVVGADPNRACAELCAYTLAVIGQTRSCSAGLFRTGAGANWRAIISVSGPALPAAPANIAGTPVPANVGVTIGGAVVQVPVAIESTPIPAPQLPVVYDTCRLSDRAAGVPKNQPAAWVCTPPAPDPSAGLAAHASRTNRGWSRLNQMDAWGAFVVKPAAVHNGPYPNPDPHPGPPLPLINNHMGLKGGCSEDKAIYAMITALNG